MCDNTNKIRNCPAATDSESVHTHAHGDTHCHAHGHAHCHANGHAPFHNLFGELHASYPSQLADAPSVVPDDENTALARKTAERSPSADNLLALAGALCFQLRYKEAAEVYERVLKTAPDNYLAARKLALCMLKTRRYDEARVLLAECDRQNPDNLDVIYRRGLCEFYDGNFAEAVGYFRRCYPLAQNDADMYVAAIYWHLLSLVRAGKPTTDAVRRYSPDLKIGHHLGYLLACKLFAEEDTPANLVALAANDDEMTRTILLYGLYHFRMARGERESARDALGEMLALDTYWGSFAWLAAYNDGIAEGLTTDTRTAARKLKKYFSELNGKGVAIAYSGGTDSACLAACARTSGIRAKAYLVSSELRSEASLAEAERLAKEIGIEVEVLRIDVLSDENIASNSGLRCYHCKRALLSAVSEAAKKDGFETVADGTNASDDAADRAGMRALSELGIISPFRECGTDKNTVRALAREMGLSVWNAPSDSCLATRVATGQRLSSDILSDVGRAEKILAEAGFRGFRVKVDANRATVLVRPEEYGKLEESGNVLLDKIYEIFDGAYPSTGIRR